MKRVSLVAALATALAAALPAIAATPTFKANVGPGFTIEMVPKPIRAGKIRLVIDDESAIHTFHLTGEGVNVKTSVAAVESKTFAVTLKNGTYTFICYPHPFMKGSFTAR